MKTKKFNKLLLNKQTVASLNSENLNAIHGGATEDCGILTKMPICIPRKTSPCILLTDILKTIKTTTYPTGTHNDGGFGFSGRI